MIFLIEIRFDVVVARSRDIFLFAKSEFGALADASGSVIANL